MLFLFFPNSLPIITLTSILPPCLSAVIITLMELYHHFDSKILIPTYSQPLNDRKGFFHLVYPLLPVSSLEENDAMFANYHT
jgi:hypothetical protein